MKTKTLLGMTTGLLCAGAVASAQPILITGMETGSVTSPFPGGSDEWAAFGTSFDDIEFTVNPTEVDAGTRALYISITWNSWGMGTAYNLPGAPLDISAGPVISYRAYRTVEGPGIVRFRLQETDGDVWVGTTRSLSTSYETYKEDLTTSLTLDDGGGDSTLDLTQVASVGFLVLANGSTASDNGVYFFDEIYYNDSISGGGPGTPPDLPVVTSIEPPDTTSGGFPPDPPTGGTVGEWTRFGTAYNGILIINNSAEATDGDNYLDVSGFFDPGIAQTRVGIRHKPYQADWSAYDAISFDVRSVNGLAGSTVELAFFESNGDIWVSNPIPVTTTWDTVSVNFADLIPGIGTPPFIPDDIVLWGFNVDNSTTNGVDNFYFDNVVLTSGGTSVPDWHLMK